MQFAYVLSFKSNDPYHMQTMLNKLRTKKVNTQKSDVLLLLHQQSAPSLV